MPSKRPKVMPPVVTLRAIRQARGLTLEQVAERINAAGVSISKSHLNNVELGNRVLENPAVMAAWLEVLGIPGASVETQDKVAVFVAPEVAA